MFAQDTLNKRNIEPDPEIWDLNKIVIIIVQMIDHQYMKDDFIINDKYENTQKVK